MKCQNNRERERVHEGNNQIFVLQFGRYEPSSTVSCQAPCPARPLDAQKILT